MSVYSVCIVLCNIINSLLTNRVAFQNASSSGGDVGVIFLGDADKVNHDQFSKNPEYSNESFHY